MRLNGATKAKSLNRIDRLRVRQEYLENEKQYQNRYDLAEISALEWAIPLLLEAVEDTFDVRD